ncbi:MAG: pentapeptide repeat-containing protein [Alphaproteobacteria bacterium]|nr:pentapeptide repeat-containing protein [Alphaproteobacteria bacterium]
MTRSFRAVGALTVVMLSICAAAASSAEAANPTDIARAKNTKNMGECVRCDLSKADLRYGFFQLAVMIEADLSGAKFDGANLAGAQLNNANMSNASFAYTNFSGAQLQGADMRSSNFSNAWLNWAWLAGAKLDGANFTNVNLSGAQLQGADLSKTIGLTDLQLATACGDSTTRLPPGISAPRCPY